MASTSNTLERLELIFTANQEQFNKQLKSIEDSIAGVKASVEGVSTGMNKNMTGAMTKAQLIAQVLIKTFEKVVQVVTRVVKAVYNLGKNLMTSGSQLSRMKVATNTLGRNLGITQGELDGLRDSLADANTYGIKAEQVISSLARTGLIDMAKSLEGVDARTGEAVTGVSALVLTMKDLGAVAGKSSSEAIAQITDFISRGRTEAVEDMIAIGNLGTEYREYAKTLGKTRGELTAQEEAQARMNIVQREGAKAFGAYAEAYTTSGKMLDSITDATKSTFEELGAMLEPIWASATTAVLGFVQNVRNFVKQNEEVIKNWATKVAGWVVYVAETIAQFMSKIPVIGQVFQSLTNIQVKVAKSSEGLNDSVEGEADTMEDASSSASKLNKELAGLAGFDEMDVLKQPETAGGTGATAVPPTTPGMFENFGAEVDKVIENIKNSIADKLDPIKKKFKDFFKPIIDAWNLVMKPVIEELKYQWGELIKTIGQSEVLKNIGKALGVIAVIIGAVLVGAITGVIKTIKGLISALDNIAKFIGWVIGSIIGLFIDFGGTIKMMWQDIKNFFIKLWDDILGYFKRLWDQQPEIVRNALTNVWNWVVNIFTQIKDWMAGIWDSIGNKVNSVLDNIVNWIKSKVNIIGNTFEVLRWWIPSIFENIKNSVAYFMQNIIDNITNKIVNIKNRFVDLGNSIGRSLKDVINNVIWRINTMFIGRINGINLLGIKFNIPQVPYLATGGVVKDDTLAMLHRSSNEAVLPLKGNTEWISELAGMINSNNGGGGNLIVKIGDDTIYDKAIEYIREKSLRTGTNILNL